MKLAGYVSCLLLLGGAAWAQPQPPGDGGVEALTAERSIAERSIEELRRELQDRRSPVVQQLRVALEVAQRQPAEAIPRAVLLQQDPLFLPYGLHLEATSSRTVARELLAQGKPPQALEAATRSLTLFQAVPPRPW